VASCHSSASARRVRHDRSAAKAALRAATVNTIRFTWS
jgi:hypothetical protein